jgi:hypothetical protein
MNLVIELLGNVMVSSGIIGGTLLVVKRFRRKRVDDGSLPWSIYQTVGDQYNRVTGFKCPKCCNMRSNHKQYPICLCEDYHTDHFHFKCNDCGHKNILRTADDK